MNDVSRHLDTLALCLCAEHCSTLLQVLDTLALNCAPSIRTQLGHKRFMQPVTALAGDKRQGPCSDAALQLLVDWAFMYKCAPTWGCAHVSKPAGAAWGQWS